MDIPLPGEDVPEEIKPPDIPMPEDSNRYSPSVPIEDDPPPGIVPPPPPPPLPPPDPAPQSATNSAKSLVLGKTQAKKRLLAFSMTKQGGGVGLSFSLNKKQAPLNKDAVKVFTGDEKTEEGKKKNKKGTREDKARDTISEIEELKRKEMLYRENMQLFHPRWGRENHLYPSLTLPIPLSVDDIPTKRTVEIESIVGELFANKLKAKEEERKHSDIRERRRKSSKRSPDKDRERSSRRRKIKTLPHDWAEFKKEGHRIHNFRRFKYEVEKEELREKRRHHRGSRDRRSRSRERRDKMSKSGSDRLNFLETPMIIKKVLHVIEARGGGDLEFPEYLIRYTNTKPKLTYCENPKIATYYLQSRREMLATVPRDIEEIIFKFINSIRAKRLRNTTKDTLLPNSVKVKKEDEEDENDDITDKVQSDKSGCFVENDSVHNGDEKGLINSESNETLDDKTQVYTKKEVCESEKIDDTDQAEKEITCHKHHREWYPIYKNSLMLSDLITEDEDVEIEEFAVNVTDNSNKVISKGGESTTNNMDRLPDSKAADKKLNEELEPIIRTAIRSKWDSDYEESPHVSDAEKTTIKKTVVDMENLSVAAAEEQMDVQDIDNKMCQIETTEEDNLGVVPMEVDNEKMEEEGDTEEFIEEHVWSTVVKQRQEGEGGDAVEKLASEYEEFMKMVASENKDDLSDDGQEKILISTSETIQENSFSNSESKLKEDSPDYDDKVASRTQSPFYENEEQNDTQNDNDIWSGKFGYTNRSRSQSSASSEYVREDDNLQVALRKKLIEKAMKKKKDKKKVHGSKIKKRSKNKKQKLNKKKKKKQSSSESSSSSSSSSSSQSSSSSSSSSSDESSSSDSSSSSSDTSSSSSSSDSSVDKKKARKRKKLKKLKQKLKLKKKKRPTSESSSSSDDEDEEDEGRVKSEKNKRKRKKQKSVKKLKRKTSDEDVKLKKNKTNKKSKDKKNKGREYVDTNNEENNVKVKKNKHDKKKKKSNDSRKSKYDSSDEEKSKKSKRSKSKENSYKKQNKRKLKEFESDDDENYTRLKESGFMENDGNKESSFKVKTAVLSEVQSKEGKYDKRSDSTVKGKRKMKEFEDESDNSDNAERDHLSKRTKHVDSESKKDKSKDYFEIESEDVFPKEKSESKRKIIYDDLDASVDNENSRRSSIQSTKEWDNEENSNSKKFKTKISVSSIDNESRSKKWETEESETFKDHEAFSQKEVGNKISSHKAVSHGWESDDESDETDRHKRGIENDVDENSDGNSEQVQTDVKMLHDELLKAKKKSKKDSKKKKSKQNEPKGSSDDEKRSKKKKKKSKKSSKSDEEASEKTDYLNVFFQTEERSNRDQKYYHRHKSDFDFCEYSSIAQKESEESVNSGAAHNKSNDSLKHSHDENKQVDSLDENSRDEASKDEQSFNDSVKSRSHYEWSDDSQTVASFAKHKDEEKLNEENVSRDDWTKENSSQYLSEQSNSKSSKTVSVGDYLKTEEETNKITFQEENKTENKSVEKNIFEQSESLQKEASEESDTFTFLKSFKKNRKLEHSEESSDNSDGIKAHSTESSIDGLDFDSQQDSFELEKDTSGTKNTENTDLSQNERAFSEISLTVSDNQVGHSNSSSKLTNDSERYSPTLDLDAGSPSSINKYESDMSLDSNEPDNYPSSSANQDVNMLDIPLPPSSATVSQDVKPLCVLPPTSVSVPVAISSSAPTPVPVPAPVPAPVPVPPPAFQPKITSSSFKNVLNIPSFPPLPSDSDSKHMEQIEHHPIQLDNEPIEKVESKVGHGDSKSESETLPLQGIRMPLKNTKITFHKPLLRTKTPNIFDNSDEEEENVAKKKSLKIDFENDNEKETEEKLDSKQKKRSRWGMEPDDELPIVKLYLASEEVQKAPAQVEIKDEDSELYEGKTLTEGSGQLNLVSNSNKITEDSNEKSIDDLYKDIIDPTDLVGSEVQCTDSSKKDILQEVWFEHNSSSSILKPNLDKEVEDSSELSENKSFCEDSDRHDNIHESHLDMISNTSDLNTVSDEIQGSAVKIKVEVESDEHTYNENDNYMDLNFQIKEEPETKQDDFELAARHERSRSRSYSRDEHKKNRDYSPDRSYMSRRKVSPRDRRYTRDRRRDSDRRRDRSRSRERRRDRSRERRRRDSPERRDRRKDKYRRESPPRERKRERRDSPPARRDSPPRRNSPPRRDSPISRRDSPSPRRDSSPRRRVSLSPRRDSPLQRRDSPLPRRDTPPQRRDSPPPRWDDNDPLLRRDSPSLQRNDSPSWGRNSREKNALSSVTKQSDLYHQTDFQEYKNDEKILSYQLQPKTDVDHVPQSGHRRTESDLKSNSAIGCKRSKADSTISDSELITPKKILVHSDLSPKRLSLDARIELELGVKKSPPPPPPPSVPTSVNVNQYPAYYQIPVHDGSQMIPIVSQLPPQRRPPSTLVQPPQMEWNAEAFIGTAAQQRSQPQAKMVSGNSQVLQVGNILQVVPTEMAPPKPVMPPQPVIPPLLKQIITTGDGAQTLTKVVQIGNMLQVVPSTVIVPPKLTVTNTPSPVPTPTPPPAPPTPPKPSPLSLPLPIIKKELPLPPLPVLPDASEKAELRRLEKERRRKEKELKRQQKFKKATKKIIKKLLFKEGLTTNADVENEEMQLIEEAADELDVGEVPIPPRTKPVTPLPPPPDKGILVSPGFREKPILTEKLPTNKVVSFADGIRPGEGTSPSAGEDHPMSPPPACTLPKEKRFKKKKKKRKVKVRIIRVEEGDDDDDDDDEDISPPPPPPGSPPPMFHYPPPPPGFMYHPPSFSVLQGSGEGQMFAPVYQQHHSSTTTTHTTTVQFAPPPPPPPQKAARK